MGRPAQQFRRSRPARLCRPIRQETQSERLCVDAIHQANGDAGTQV